MRKSRGFSLVESIVVFSVLGILSVLALALFSYGSRGFQLAVLRQGLQGEAEGVRRKLKYDFKPSHQSTVGVFPRQMTLADGTMVSRDAVAFATLSDWRDPTNYTAAGLPQWNRYVVYYATLGESGRLVRQVVDPGAPLFGPIPYGSLGTNVSDDPIANSNVVQSTVLSQNVLSLKIDRNDARQLLELTLLLRDGGNQRVNSGSKVDEVQESVFSLEALNTFPRL